MLLRVSFVVLALAWPGLGLAQTSRYVDSLLRIARQPKPDTNVFNAYAAIQRYYFNRGQYDSTVTYSYLNETVANALGDKRRMAMAQYNLALVFTNLTRYDSALARLDRVEALLPDVTDTTVHINFYNAHTLLRNYQSDYSGAIEYLMKAAELIEKSSNPAIRKLLPQTYGNLGHNLIAEKQFEKGIEYEKKALRITGYESEQRYRTLIHLDIFDAYVRLKDIRSARAHLDTAVNLSSTLNNVVVAGLVANNEGMYYDAIGDNEGALKAYRKSYDLTESTGNNYLKAGTAANMARIYLALGNGEAAGRYAMEANGIGKQLRDYDVVASTYETLMNINSRKGDFRTALQHAQLFKVYSDSATNKSTQAAALAMENKYQNQRREREIASLKMANIQYELERARQNRLLAGGTIASVSLIVILALAYRNSRQRSIMAEKEKQFQQERITFLERQQQVVSLQGMINGQEAERSRIARDLHDGLGGLFSTVKMYFSTLQHENPALGKNELFQKGYSVIDTASVEVRRIAHNLMPEVLLKLGLVNALKDLCDNISTGKLLNVSLEVHGMNDRLNTTTEIMLFRIVQELLNNIVKHAQASEAIIQCVKDQSRLSLIVEDNGRGFDTGEVAQGKHSGMSSVRNRVDYLRGKMTIDSQKNVGTTVMMDFSVNEPAYA